MAINTTHRRVPAIITTGVLVASLCALGFGARVAPSSDAPKLIVVKYREGNEHGFVVLHDPAGKRLAVGDSRQTEKNGHIVSTLTFRFPDGSRYEEVTEYVQAQTLSLVRYHEVKSGPSFHEQSDFVIDIPRSVVTVHSVDKKGQPHDYSQHVPLPRDLANGMVGAFIKNAPAFPVEFPYLAATPEPRMVHIAITSSGQRAFVVSGETRQATEYTIHPKIGGIAGLIAPLIGKQPPDSRVWFLGGDAPAFMRAENQMIDDGPLWVTLLASPDRQ
jgi:hypothetical protein